MKWFWSVLIILIVALQWRLWVGEGSLAEWSNLQDQIADQEAINSELRERNQQLDAEVQDLKQGLDSIEERARTELGMIKEGETFIQLVEPSAHKKPPASDKEPSANKEPSAHKEPSADKKPSADE